MFYICYNKKINYALRESNDVKVRTIAQDITSAIANDEYNVGDKLPSVEQLKARYEVSKSTIIKALAILQRDGMIFQTRVEFMYEIKINQDISTF